MRLSLAMTSVLVATSLLAVPAIAAPLGAAVPKTIAAQIQSGDDTLVTQVQYRHGYRGGYRYRDRSDDGAGIAAGIIGGLMLGAIIANQSQRGGRTVEYCMRRFRSYDPNSGTYLGNDGYRHRCP